MPGKQDVVLTGDAKPPTPFETLLKRMELEASIDEGDVSKSTLIAGVEKVMQAETEEEMWSADDLAQIGGRDLRDVEQRILDYLIKKSSNADINTPFVDSKGLKMYLLITSTKLENGEEFVWNTSAPLIVAKIFWLTDHDKLPYDCVIRGTDLGGGQAVLKLKPLPRRAVRADQ